MTSEALTTKARVKDRLQISVTSFDTLIDNIILAVSARIQQMTGRNFLLATYTNELYDGCDVTGTLRSILVIKNAPVVSLTSIQYKAGSNSNPTWTSYDEDDYDIDMDACIVYFKRTMPRGKRNIRITYAGGFSGYSIGLSNVWTFNVTPTGAVNGINRTFTLPATATSIVVYADGLRISTTNYTFTPGTDSIVFNEGQQPFTAISVDYSNASVASDNPTLPADLVEVCEEVTVRIFKRRDSEGRTSESFQESSISWTEGVFTKENRTTVMNYRRSSFL